MAIWRNDDGRTGKGARIAGAVRHHRLAEQRQHRGIAEMKQRQRRAEHEQRARPQQHGECRNVFAVVRRGAARRPVIDRAGIDGERRGNRKRSHDRQHGKNRSRDRRNIRSNRPTPPLPHCRNDCKPGCDRVDAQSRVGAPSPSVIAAMAAPAAAPAMPVATCAAPTRMMSGRMSVAIDAAVITSALSDDESALPRGAIDQRADRRGDRHPGDAAEGHDDADLGRGPMPCLQKDAEERPKAALHVGHEEIQGVERKKRTPLCRHRLEQRGNASDIRSARGTRRRRRAR